MPSFFCLHFKRNQTYFELYIITKEKRMKLLKLLIFCTLIYLSAVSCKKNDANLATIEITGTLKEQGITTYQYGTHTIAGYALRSSTVTLDDYINQNVTVVGYKIEGYPVDGGPDFIEVEEIK